MTDKTKAMRMVYLSTDAHGKNVRRSRTFNQVMVDAENVNIKKAADAINTLTVKPCDAVEVVTVEALI